MIESPYTAVVDPLFKAAGFEVNGGLIRRVITGRYAGRDCRIHLHPSTRTRYRGEIRHQQYLGHQLVIALSVGPRTRCGLLRRGNLRPWSMRFKRWLGFRPVEPMPASLPLLACWAFEPDWAAGWLAAPDVQDTLLRLFTAEQTPHVLTITLDPVGRIAMMVQRVDVRRIAPQRFEHWLADLQRLAQAIDGAPPPLRVLSQTGVERFIERRPMATALGFFAIAIAVLFLASILVFAPLVLLLVWLGK